MKVKSEFLVKLTLTNTHESVHNDFGLRHNYSPKFPLKNYCIPALSHWPCLGFWNDGTGLL
ncbi:MAG: hypothetical protein IJP54_07450 [Synergistaceae bacterium]|nr:hypothetical protein [Synergistaceae bacterium]